MPELLLKLKKIVMNITLRSGIFLIQYCTFFSCTYPDCVHKQGYGKRTANKQDWINLQDFHFLVTKEAVVSCIRHHIAHRTSAEACIFSKVEEAVAIQGGKHQCRMHEPFPPVRKAVLHKSHQYSLRHPNPSGFPAKLLSPTGNQIKNSLHLSIIRINQFQLQKCEFGSIATSTYTNYTNQLLFGKQTCLYLPLINDTAEHLMTPKHLQNTHTVPTKYMNSSVLDIYLELFS